MEGSDFRVYLMDPSVVHTLSILSSSRSSFICLRVGDVRSSTMKMLAPSFSEIEARTSLLFLKTSVLRFLLLNLMMMGGG